LCAVHCDAPGSAIGTIDGVVIEDYGLTICRLMRPDAKIDPGVRPNKLIANEEAALNFDRPKFSTSQIFDRVHLPRATVDLLKLRLDEFDLPVSHHWRGARQERSNKWNGVHFLFFSLDLMGLYTTPPRSRDQTMADCPIWTVCL
jgi:hypothetical protein